jgi:hypothetical protein
MDRVHGSWTAGGAGPRWTQNRGEGGGSPELQLLAGTGHGGSSQGGENEEELTGVRFRPSPERVWWRRGDATAMELQLGMATVRVR